MEVRGKVLQGLKDSLASNLYNMTASEAISQHICISCKEIAEPKCYSVAGRREYYITGLCEECFDDIFKEDTGPYNPDLESIFKEK